MVRHGVLNANPTAHLIVEQGYEMGRPSMIYVEVDGTTDGPTAVRVGGTAVEVAEGTIKI